MVTDPVEMVEMGVGEGSAMMGSVRVQGVQTETVKFAEVAEKCFSDVLTEL